MARQGLSKQRSGIETKSHLPRDRQEPGLAARVLAGSRNEEAWMGMSPEGRRRL